MRYREHKLSPCGVMQGKQNKRIKLRCEKNSRRGLGSRKGLEEHFHLTVYCAKALESAKPVLVARHTRTDDKMAAGENKASY